jgi:hypothetical protein
MDRRIAAAGSRGDSRLDDSTFIANSIGEAIAVVARGYKSGMTATAPDGNPCAVV